MRLPVLSGRKVVRALSHVGFRVVAQRGSHIRLKRTDTEGSRIVIVPDHAELAPGTLRSILRQAGIDRETFRRLL